MFGDAPAVDLDELAPTADLVRMYLVEIGRTPLLSAAQEVDLAKRIEAGVYAAELLRRAEAGEDACGPASRAELTALAADGETAKAHMVRANLRLVVSAAKRYVHHDLPFLDVVQEGNLGLIRAVEKFDYRKGYKFSTYAMWWIRQAIGRGTAEQARTIRLPVHVQEELAKVRRAERTLTGEDGLGPTETEIAAATGLAPERVAELRALRPAPVSLDSPIGDEGERVIGDLIADTDTVTPADTVEHQAMTAALGGIVDRLPEREATIIRMRYGLQGGRPHTLEEVGQHLKLTRERIRQLEKLALAKLRHPSATRELSDWAA